jgi:hypothetical protein
MVLRALAILLLITTCPAAFAQQGQCDPGAFREAVAQASATLTVLHEKNGSIFQENLQKLRVLNKWQDAEYIANATPLVKDDTTATFDAENQALLARVQSLDAAGAATESGRCAMLTELKAAMEKVVANTSAKWQHMLDKLSRASMRPIQAGFSR